LIWRTGRFQSALDVSELLSRCLAHVQEPLTVPLPPEVVALSATVSLGRKSCACWAAAALLAIATIGGGAFAFWPRAPRRGTPERTIEREHKRESGRSIQAASNAVAVVTLARNPADELEAQLAEVQRQAQAVDYDLHRSCDCQYDDPWSALVRSLTERSARLEAEMASGHPAPPSTGP
jgi:hypothetical protein